MSWSRWCGPLGIDRVVTVDAYEVRRSKPPQGFVKATARASDRRRECRLLPEARRRWKPLRVVAETCNAAQSGFRIRCPAILRAKSWTPTTQRPKARSTRCCAPAVRCVPGLPGNAILFGAIEGGCRTPLTPTLSPEEREMEEFIMIKLQLPSGRRRRAGTILASTCWPIVWPGGLAWT